MNAIQTLLTDHIGIWTAAETEKKSGRGRASGNAGSVYGIRKLRELILELAVRGKLVPQDANDEPASALLKRIQAEKARLIAEGKIRKDKPLAPITDEETPFALPQGWDWAKLGFIGYTQTGATPSKSSAESFGSDIPFIKPGDIYPNYVEYSNEGLSFSGAEQSGRIAPSGSILMVCIGTIGKCNLIERDCSFNQQINSVTPYTFDSNFLLSVCRSIYFHTEAWSRSSSTTIAILNKGNWEDICIPVPPIEEQHRIVAKVDELMTLCDQLEARHSNAADAHEKLVSHLLGTLTQSQSAEDFSGNWQRIAAHFDTLFTTEASIDALKQTLLQLAVMGKLVPQDPNDEPASELLKRFGVSSTASSLAGWSKVSLGELGNIYGGATPSKAKSEYWMGNIPWVSPKDMKRFYIDDAEDKVSEGAVRETSLKLIPAGSLLMVVRGMILAHSFPVALTIREVTINQDMKALVVPEAIKEYILLYMRAMKNSFVALVDRSSHGTCKLISGKLWMAAVEIPPKAEQHRIVAKVDELMALCDRLKSRLADASQLRQKLADVLVAQAVA